MASESEPTLGEVVRNIQSLARSVETLSSRVVTSEVWSTERQMIDLRMTVMTENLTKLTAALEKERTERTAEREKDQLKAQQDRDKVQGFRRQIIFAISTALFMPILSGIVLLVIQGLTGGGG